MTVPVSTVRRQPWKYVCFPHPTGSCPISVRGLLTQSDKIADQTRSFTTPLNPRRRPLGHYSSRIAIPGQTQPAERRDIGAVVGFRRREQTEVRTPDRNLITDPMSHAPRDAPEPNSHFQRAARPPKRPHHGTAEKPGTLCPGSSPYRSRTFRDTCNSHQISVIVTSAAKISPPAIPTSD